MPKDLRQKSAEELKAQAKTLEEEIFRLKLKKSSGQLEKTHTIKLTQKDLARVLTIQREARNSGK